MHSNHPYRCAGADGVPAEGHISPLATLGEEVVNCLRCGRRLYWDGFKDKYLPKADDTVKAETPKDTTVGYFNWSRNERGLACPEKILKVHVDAWLAMNKHQYRRYKDVLIHSVKLDEAQYALSLSKLAEKYPCPKFDALQGLHDATQ